MNRCAWTPGEKIWNQHYITLEENVDEVQLAKAFWRPGDKSTRWIDYLAGGVAVASGVMAVRFKTKADRRYARYERSGDPTLRPGFERFDRYAAISLGTIAGRPGCACGALCVELGRAYRESAARALLLFRMLPSLLTVRMKKASWSISWSFSNVFHAGMSGSLPSLAPPSMITDLSSSRVRMNPGDVKSTRGV